MKKFFTLIEMIVVIVILGVLAAIVIPNVSDQKEKSITSMVNANIRILQTAVDTYSLKNNGEVPTAMPPTLENPQIIDIDSLYPKYLKSKPDYNKVKNQKYWVDVFGKVWGATTNSPDDIYTSDSFVEWNYSKNVKEYNLYKIAFNKATGKLENRKVLLNKSISIKEASDKVKVSIDKDSEVFLVSSIDQYGLESAPVGPNAIINEDWFKPIVKKDGVFEFEMVSKDLMYWDGYHAKKDEPEGTSIKFEFSVQNEQGTYEPFTSDFKLLAPSKAIKVKVISTAYNGKYPSLYDLRIFYHFEEEEVLRGTPLIRENVDNNGNPIDSEQQIRVSDEFILPPDKQVKDIIVQDDYNIQFPPNSHYLYKEGDNWISTPSISDIPKGSTIRIERQYSNGNGVTIKPVLITPSSNLKVVEDQLIESEWKTLNQLSFYANTTDGQVAHWIRSEIVDVEPEGTRIVYKYSNEYSSEIDDISKLKDSHSVKVTAYRQVKTNLFGKVQDPEIKSIKLVHERGAVDLSLVLPTAMIIPEKSNNKTNLYFSPETIINWKYEAQDPRNLEITEVEWSGDKRTQYPVGIYEVKLRVKNESNYWSEWTSYKFEVKPDKPIAVISMTPDTNIRTNTPITWSAAGSYDPDGDGIANVEWQNKQDKYTVEGNHTVRLRVQDNEGYWSDWVEKTFPVTVAFEVKSISQGYDHTLFLLKNGQVKSYGSSNSYGQLGSTTVVNRRADINNLSNVKEIYAGQYVSFALLNDGTVMSWGYNQQGQLGTGDKINKTTPTPVSNLNNVKKVAHTNNGADSVLYLLNDGTVMGSGRNNLKTLGQSATSFETNVPIKVANFNNAKDLFLTQRNAYAILEDGTVMAWGNLYGHIPVEVSIFKNATKIVNVNDMEIALFENGAVKGRGYNRSKILGETTPYQTTTLNEIKGLTDIVEIELTCSYPECVLFARESSGSIKVIGDITSGILGIKPLSYTYTPMYVKTVTNTINIESNVNNAFALLPDGSFYWWGNYNGAQDPRIGDWYKKTTALDPTPF